jgi:2'-5' RNA ligase
MIRLFFALTISMETQQKLYAHMLPLQSRNIRGSWVRAENLHVTLKFLGDTDEYAVPMLKDTLTMLANQTTRIPSTITHISAFPSLRNPRVLFFEVKEHERITSLAEYLNNHCIVWGFPKEDKKFLPHITFCRIKQHCNLEYAGINTLLDFAPIPYVFKDITLYKSVLTTSGARYEEIQTCPFHL